MYLFIFLHNEQHKHGLNAGSVNNHNLHRPSPHACPQGLSKKSPQTQKTAVSCLLCSCTLEQVSVCVPFLFISF